MDLEVKGHARILELFLRRKLVATGDYDVMMERLEATFDREGLDVLAAGLNRLRFVTMEPIS